MEKARDVLLNLGHEVKVPNNALEMPQKYSDGEKVYFGQYIEKNGGIDAFPATDEIWKLKEGAINDHFKKIDWADVILVINNEKNGVPGYVGGNTLIEIGVSFYLKKQIYILNSVSSELLYKQEIMGMNPIFINGDLSKIK